MPSPAVASHLTRAHPLAHASLSLQNMMKFFFDKNENARFLDPAFRFDPGAMIIGGSIEKKAHNQRGNWHMGRAHLMQCGGSKRPMENREGLGRRVRHRSHELRRGVLRARAPGRDSVL